MTDLLDELLPERNPETARQRYEEQVLGGLMYNPSRIHDVREILEPQDFATPHLRTIYAVMCQLDDEGAPWDLASVTARLIERRGRSTEAVLLLGAVNSDAHVVHDAHWVQDASRIHKLRLLGQDIISETQVGSVSAEKVEQIVEMGQRELTSLAADAAEHTHTGHSLREGFLESLERVKSLDGQTAIGTGLQDLDRTMSGLQPSELTVIGARPSMGKTAMAVHLALHAARSSRSHLLRPARVLLFSLEMSAERLWQRLVANVAGINSRAIAEGFTTQDQDAALREASAELAALPIVICDQPAASLTAMRGRARKEAQGEGVDLILVDYLQLMATGGPEKRYLQVGENCRGLRNLGRELKIPVVLLAQLNRALADSKDKRPYLHHLRESGDIEQDADVVLFLHRPAYYSEDEDPRLCEIIVGKNRNGPTGIVKTDFDAKTSRFFGRESSLA